MFSTSIGEVAAALAKAQGAFGCAALDMVNPHFRSRYSSLQAILETVKKPLADNSLALFFLPETSGKLVTVTAMLAHASGQFISCRLVTEARDAGPQSIGSAITYLKRYTGAALLGIASGDEADDDGNSAQKGSPKAVEEKSAPRVVKKDGYNPKDLKHRMAFEAGLAKTGIDKIFWAEANELMKGKDSSEMDAVLIEVKRLTEVPL